MFGWNLGNSLDSYVGTTIGCNDLTSETSWGNLKTTQAFIDSVKSTGINAIRVPVTWYNHMDANYNIDEAWLDRVEEVVNYIIDNETYCILNVHHDTGEKGWLKASSTNLEQNKEMFEAIWKQLSARFEKYGDELLFEGFNEILDDNSEWVNPSQESLNIVNDLNQIFVDTVRKSGGNNAERCLIVNTYAASGNPYVTSNFKVPNDSVSNRLIAEVHIYQPFYFTSEAYPEEITWEQNKMYLDEQLDAVYNNFVKNGIPAIVGEFGCADKGNMDEIISWAEYYVDTCTDYGIKCFWWDNGTQYKIFNRNTGNCTQPDLLGTMLAEANNTSYTPDNTVYGDANGDGVVTADDVKLLKKYLFNMTNTIQNCDLNNDNVVDVTDLALLKSKIIKQNNLCANSENWSSWVDTTGGADADVNYTSNGVTVDVRNGGTNVWDVQAAYKNITLEEGAEYKLSFDYSCTVEQSMECHVMQNYGDYIPYYSATLDYTNKVQHFEDTFVMNEKTDKNTQISFNMGGSDVIPGTVEISNLSLVKVSGGTSSDDSGNSEDDDNKSEITDENLCSDSSNWGSWIYEDGAAASVKTLDNGIKIDVEQSGEEEWYIQGSYSNLTLEKGAKYHVEFDYEATKDVYLGFHIQQNYEP